MGKKETKQTYADTRADKAKTEARYDAAIDTSNKAIGGLDPTGTRDNLAAGYSGLGNNVRALGFNPISAPRQIDTGALQNTLPRLKEFGDTGGFSDERTASIMENVGGLKEIGRTGGLSSENIERMRGMGGFDEFAKTGGYTPESIANIKAQALSPISSYATGTRDELARRSAISGGYAPGFDAANRQLSRDTSRAIADTSLNANVGIQDRINQGRQWGIGGIAQSEGGIAGLQSSNKLQGLQAAGSLELQLQDTISRYRAMGLSMEQATATALAEFDSMNVGNEMRANMFNAEGQTGVDQFNINNQQNMNLAGMSGLQNLYNVDVGREQNERDRRHQLLGGQTNANLGYLSGQNQLAVQPGVGGNIISGIGAAAGVAGAVYTGGLSIAARKALEAKK